MKLVKFRAQRTKSTVGLLEGEGIIPLALDGRQYRSLADILEADDPVAAVDLLADRSQRPLSSAEVALLAPIDTQEVWAAGVTYQRSKAARMEESAAAASCYDRVYGADRPELFFKATENRVVGNEQPVRIRRDAQWNVPEPELALVLNSRMQLVGFTVGNDMSARDIEGENPLYLPQAKTYDSCCALGPAITLADSMPNPAQVGIQLVIRRGTSVVFQEETNTSRMARSFEDLIGWLSRDNTFPGGAFLLTGTGIVPDDSFTLAAGDVIEITIDGIGTLSNPVVQG